MYMKPERLYDIAINAAVRYRTNVRKVSKTAYRVLPNNALFDVYYKMFQEETLCLLAAEFRDLEVMNRLTKLKHQRCKLLTCFQAAADHVKTVQSDLIESFTTYVDNPDSEYDTKIIEMGLRMGQFFIEGGWYPLAVAFLNITERICKKQEQDVHILKRLLECYQLRIYPEAVYCKFEEAEDTFRSAQETVSKLEELNAVPNLAGLYAHYSLMYFIRSEYDKAYVWSEKALKLISDVDVPVRVIIEVLRQASKSCVVKRRFNQAGLLIRQAVNLAEILYKKDRLPHYSDTLLDYGFYLLNYDSIKESVTVYEKALEIRKDVFLKNNIHVALAYEDLAYALYVNEYSSGNFNIARNNVKRAIKNMEKVLPKDHLMLASVKRVYALILEEMALDTRNDPDRQSKFLNTAEELHKTALELSHKAYGEKNVQTAKHYGNLGRLYQSLKQFDEAERMHLRAIAIKEELLGKDDYEVGLSIGHLASLYNYHMKRYLDAEKLYLRSIEINLNLFGESYSGLEYDYRGLNHVYLKLQDASNVVVYNAKMREWKELRDAIVPMEHKEEILPIKEIVNKFFEMNQ